MPTFVSVCWWVCVHRFRTTGLFTARLDDGVIIICVDLTMMMAHGADGGWRTQESAIRLAGWQNAWAAQNKPFVIHIHLHIYDDKSASRFSCVSLMCVRRRCTKNLIFNRLTITGALLALDTILYTDTHHYSVAYCTHYVYLVKAATAAITL